MVKKLSFSTKWVVLLGGTGLLALGTGCSRMMSPPGQRLFGQPSAEQPDWNRPSRPDDASGEWSQSSRDPSLDGTDPTAFGNPPFSAEGALDHHFAQSIKIPEATPPRLIPIESVTFPGDPSEVVTAAATMTDSPGSKETLTVAFSSPTSDPEKHSTAVKQAVVLSDLPVSNSASTASVEAPIATTTNLPTFNTTDGKSKSTQPTTPVATNANAKSKTQPDYNRSLNKVNASKHEQGFQADQFQAARRGNATAETQSSPSDSQPPVTAQTGKPAQVASASKGAANPAKPASITVAPIDSALFKTEQSAAKPGKTSSADGAQIATQATTAPSKSSKSNAEPVMKTQPVAPEIKDIAPPQTPLATSEGSGLAAAGIKVDATAFEISAPKNSKLNKAELPAKRPSAEKPALAKPPGTAATTQPPASNRQADFSATLPVKNGLQPVSPSPTASSSPGDRTAGKKEPGSPAGVTALNSQFAPLQPPSPANQASSNSPSKNSSTAVATQPAPIKSLPGTPVGQPAGQPQAAIKTLSSNPTFVSNPTSTTVRANHISELNLVGDLFPVKKPVETNAANPTNASAASSPKPAASISSPSAQPVAPASAPRQTARSQEAALELVNCQFCTEIKGFGQVTPFRTSRFKGSQRTLVYCEVENYRSQQLASGEGHHYVTRFRGDYEIVNQQGTVVQSGEFPQIEDITVRKRRDFYLYFPITFKNLPTGSYELKLTIRESLTANDEPSANRVALKNLSFAVD